MSNQNLTAELAKALGLPKNTTRAVLTLENGKPPTLDLTLYCTDVNGRFVLDPIGGIVDGATATRLATVQFMVRLESFPD